MKNNFTIHDDHSRNRMIDFVRNLSLNKKWDIEVKPHTKKRTLSQNALMWKWLDEVVKLVSDHTGHDNDEIHEIFKQKFLVPKLIDNFELGGEPYRSWSTKKLDKKEMSQYMEKIYAFCTTDLGLFLTVPQLREQDGARLG